jgi:hypothetical protein
MDKPVDHSDRQHARYAPSAAHRWLVCHGSVAASEGVPEARSSYAEEGTECHEAAAAILDGMSFDKATHDLTEQQVWIVEEYTNYVFGLIEKLESKFGRIKVWIESQVKSNEEPDYAGTADTIILAGRTLGLVDLKAGFNPVELRTEDGNPNPQLASYAVQALDTHSLWDDVDSVRLTIVQPRVFIKPQTLVVTIKELNEFYNYALGEIRTIGAGDLTRVAGSHCKYCPAKGRCPTLRAYAVEKAKIVFDGETPHPRNYEPEDLIEVLNEAEAIAAHVEGIRQHVRRELEKGRLTGMGWKLVPKRAVSKWKDHASWDTVRRAFEGFTIDTVYRLTPRTPNQIQRAIKDNKIMLDLTDLYVKESSGPTLAREDDPREEMKVDPFGKENEDDNAD